MGQIHNRHEQIEQPMVATEEQQHKEPVRTFNIPRGSFAAFRLSYATAEEISEAAETVLIGGIPEAWIIIPSLPRFLGHTVIKKRRLHRFFRKSLASRRGLSSPPGLTLPSRANSTKKCSVFKTMYQNILHPEVLQRSIGNQVRHDNDLLRRELHRQCEDDDDDDADTNSNSRYSDSCEMALDSSNHVLDSRSVDHSLCSSWPDEVLGGSLGDSSFFVNSTVISSLDLYVPQFSPGTSASHNGTHSAIVADPRHESRFQRKFHSSEQKGQNVMNSSVSRSHRAKSPQFLSFVDPAPESEEVQNHLREELITTNKESHRMGNTFRSLARRTSSEALGRRLKVRLLDRIKLFPVDEIVRIDRMLVLVKFVPKVFNIMSHDDINDITSELEAKWLEYFVILRRTHDDENLLEGQLYKVEKSCDFTKRPNFSFLIREELRVEFYSTLDKSITVIDPCETGTRIFILNARYYSQSIKWLYLIKGCLNESFYSLVAVHVGELGSTINIDIPEKLIQEAISSVDNFLIGECHTGYLKFEDILLQYVLKQIQRHWRRLNVKFVNDKHALPVEMWLACKFNERVEWIPNNSLALLIRAQLFAKGSPLELLKNPKPFSRKQPSSVEGFLGVYLKSRESKLVKHMPSYILKYFTTSKNFLFMIDCEKVIPPSFENQFLTNESDKRKVSNTIPEIFSFNTFQIDSSGHIPWLDGADFEQEDRMALDEFSRKVHHVPAAQYIFDLLHVKKMKLLSYKEIPEKIHTAHSAAWASVSKKDRNAEAYDSPFEIEFLNGSKLILIAPSPTTRLEWMSRLLDLRAFWKMRNRDELASKIQAREENNLRAHKDDRTELRNLFETFGANEEKNNKAILSSLQTSVLAMSSTILHSGELFYKHKKSAHFVKNFVILCPGYLVMFTATKFHRSSQLPCYRRTATLPLSDCYIHTEKLTQYSVSEFSVSKSPGYDLLPRIFSDGWKSTEESGKLRFTIWYGCKARLGLNLKRLQRKALGLKNVMDISGVKKKVFLFQARSVLDQEIWVNSILEEINRFAYE